MKKLLAIIICLIALFTLTACNTPTNQGNQSGAQSGAQSGSQSSGGANQTPSGQTNWFDDANSKTNAFLQDYTKAEQELYYTLWESTTKVTVKIDISAHELAKIEEAYKDYQNGNSLKADTYRKCNLTITVNGKDYYYNDVGIRMRGNTSRRSFCTEDGTIFALVHFRFDLTETFDGEEYQKGAWANDIYTEWTNAAARKERKNRTFATMEKFYYKWNKNYDNSYIREVYANKMFRENGVLAPHITLANICIKQGDNFESLGVGGLYETIDKRFIKRNFAAEEQGGDLYKCTYTLSPADLTEIKDYGVETATQRYTYSLKTNNDRSAPDYHHNQHLKDLINTLKSNKTGYEFKALLEKVVDMEYFIRFEAVNYLLGNPDCIKNNANNYYLYFTPQGKAYFIPYDYDRCLGVNYDWNPSGDGMISANPFSQYTCNGRVRNPLYTKTILDGGNADYKNAFKAELSRVLSDTWFDYQTFLAIYSDYEASYKELAMPSQKIVEQIKERNKCELFYFGLGGASANEYNSTHANISTQDYMRLKRQTAEKYI